MPDAPATVTFYLRPAARELIERLSDESGQSMGLVAVTALEYYRGLLDAGDAEKPDAARAGPEQGRRRLTIPGQTDIAEWTVRVSDESGVSRGQVLVRAAEYYAAAIETGQIPKPASKPGAEPGKKKTHAPRTQTTASVIRPTRSPTLRDRATCGTCRKQVGVDAETSLLTDHVAHPSVRPRGTWAACEGSGQVPAGPVIHSAEVAVAARGNL